MGGEEGAARDEPTGEDAAAADGVRWDWRGREEAWGLHRRAGTRVLAWGAATDARKPLNTMYKKFGSEVYWKGDALCVYKSLFTPLQ